MKKGKAMDEGKVMEERKMTEDQNLGAKSAYNSLFWGLILVLFDFRLAFFDFLPDFLGYILAATALGKLSLASDHFRKAKPFAYSLIVLSLSDFVMTNKLSTAKFIPSRENILLIMVYSVVTILTLYMVYYICQGIVERARKLGAEELRLKAGRRWWLFFAANSLSLALSPFSLNLPQSVFIYPVYLNTIVGILSYILIIAMVRDTEKVDSYGYF